MRTFLAATELKREEAEDFITRNRAQIEASGGSLDLALSRENFALFRLTLPDTMEEVKPETIFPDFKWMRVQQQVVRIPDNAEELDETA